MTEIMTKSDGFSKLKLQSFLKNKHMDSQDKFCQTSKMKTENNFFKMKLIKPKKIEYELYNLSPSIKFRKTDSNFNNQQEVPTKVKFKQYEQDKFENKFKLKIIGDHYQVFKNQQENLYKEDYMKKMFKLLNKKDKNYPLKRKMLDPRIESPHKTHNNTNTKFINTNSNFYLTAEKKINTPKANNFGILSSKSFLNLNYMPQHFESLNNVVRFKDSFDFDDTADSQEILKDSHREKIIRNLKKTYKFVPNEYRRKIHSNLSSINPNTPTNCAQNYSHLNKNPYQTLITPTIESVNNNCEDEGKSLKMNNFKQTGFSMYKKKTPHNFFMSSFMNSSKKLTTNLRNNKQIAFGSIVHTNANLTIGNPISLTTQMNLSNGFPAKKKEKENVKKEEIEKMLKEFKNHMNKVKNTSEL